VGEILIVDDQAGIRLLLNEVFKKEGYKTHIASNGHEALELFNQNNLDCILLDIKMPGIDGIEVLTQIRAIDQNVPVFMMTAYGEKELVDMATKLDVKQFFTKPFNIFEVRDHINKLINM
jgi:two-component system, response regulator, stage 0 sporulation protein F